MNRKLTLFASLLALLVSAGMALAGDLTDATLNKLLDLSGINRQTAMIPETIKAGFRQAEQNLEGSGKRLLITRQEYKEIGDTVAGAFNPETLIRIYGTKIKEDVSEADIKVVLVWLESDLGRQFTQAEVDATSEQARGNMMNDARTLLADEERVAIARHMDKLLQDTDMAIHFQVESSVATYVAFSRKLHPGQLVDVAALRKRAVDRVNRAHVEQRVILMLVYTYRNIDIPSLKKYVAYLEQPATRHYHDALRKGMLEGLDACTARSIADASNVAKKQ